MKTKMKKRNKATISKLLEHFKNGLDLHRLAALGEKAILFVADQVRRRGLRAVLDDVRDFGGILRDGAAGRFPVSRAILLQIGAALGYLFFPTDLVPDMIPVVGLGDDAAVLGYVAHCVAATLSAYRNWRGVLA